MAKKKGAKAEETVAEVKPVEEKKRKADDAPAEEPEAKKEDTEQEQDDVGDKRPALTNIVGFSTPDTTLNVVPTMGGKVLMSMNEGGMQYLIGGARANVGMKAGRYMYEVKIIEAFNPAEAYQAPKGKMTGPRQLVRIGFSVAGSPLVLGEFDECVYFDSDGQVGTGKHKRRLPELQKFGRDMTMTVVLNLDDKGDNANTISLFRDGTRLSKPFKLPENLIGKTLIPHISFRHVSVYVNFGPSPTKPLPFKCRMIQSAAEKDTAAVAAKAPKDGKYEVLLPIGFPDEGTFEWLDDFLEKNPGYEELSDRKLKEWALHSGLGMKKAGSNDKPSFQYGIPSMDNHSLQRIVSAVAPLSARNYVIMEVKSNLTKADRVNTLKRFNPETFKRVARVMMGEPKADFKKKVLSKFLKVKQERVTAQWNMKKQKQLHEKKQAEAKKQAEEKRKKAAEEAAKKKAEAEAAKKAAEKKEDGEKKDEDEKKDAEMKDAESKPEEKIEEKKEEPTEEKKEDAPMEELGEEPPEAELTEEEKKMCFLPKVGVGDLSEQVLKSSFAQFSLPDKEETFDDIKYEWQSEAKASEYLRAWVLEKKATTRIDNLTPSSYFKEKFAAWTKQKAEWETKQKAFKAAGKKNDKKEQAAVDIFAVENINDIGGEEPLYASFEDQDWALLQLRYELHLLLDAFKHDVNDPDRESIPEPHFAFYYQKYYTKALNPKMFTLENIPALVKLVKDTAVIDEEKKVLASTLSDVDSLDIFVKLGEESRRERRRRLDAGDETARLKYVPPAAPPKVPAPKPAAPKPAASPAAPKANVAIMAATAAPKAAGEVAKGTQASKGSEKGWNNAQGAKGGGSGQSWKGDGGQSWKGGGGSGSGWKGDNKTTRC